MVKIWLKSQRTPGHAYIDGLTCASSVGACHLQPIEREFAAVSLSCASSWPRHSLGLRLRFCGKLLPAFAAVPKGPG